jgi:hypothetical protein
MGRRSCRSAQRNAAQEARTKVRANRETKTEAPHAGYCASNFLMAPAGGFYKIEPTTNTTSRPTLSAGITMSFPGGFGPSPVVPSDRDPLPPPGILSSPPTMSILLKILCGCSCLVHGANGF